MKVLKLLYKDKESLTEFIQNNSFEDNYNWLVRVYASTYNKDFCSEIATTIKELIPSSTITGCNVGGVVYDAEIYDNETMIIFSGFERASVVSDFFSIDGMDEESITKRIEDGAKDLSPAIAIMHVGAYSPHTDGVIRRISKSLSHIPFVGGITGYLTPDNTLISLVFNEEGVFENTISITYVSNNFVLAYTNAVVGHAPISGVHTITEMSGENIVSIDSSPSAKWINEQLGTTKLYEQDYLYTTVSTDLLVRFPFVLEEDEGSSRFSRYEASSDQLRLHFCQLQTGTKFRIGYVSPIKSVEEWHNVCYDLQRTPVEMMFSYSCLFRKMYLNNLSKWEMAPFKDSGVCGAFMYGEICTKEGKILFFHGTCTLFTMAEKINYIKPDLSTYDRIDELYDTSDEMLASFRKLMNDANQTDSTNIFADALQNEASTMGRITSQKNSMTKFLRERPNTQKLCLVNFDASNFDIINVELSLYSIMNKMKDYCDQHYKSLNIYFYVFRKDSFFFTCDNSVSTKLFSDTAKSLYNHFTNENLELSSLKFAISLEGKAPIDLLEIIEESANKTESNFYNCDNIIDDEDNALQKEFEVVEIIKEAIKNDKIIPYFQGIYDSQESVFFAYEALMRIQTSSGEILPPAIFLEVAKKHELYLKLSQIMICKVLDLFENRSEIITMNISALDVCSPEFCKTIYSKLDQMKKTDHFIFEIVETEQFAGYDELKQFIRKMRQYGIKIAIDDFGSGYSNFIEIGNLQIDYIKINGSLTELLGTDVSYNQILDSIYYLSKKMQVSLIAECVETAAMQKTLINSGVRYSQGYLFSTPMPIEQLYVVSEENKQKSINLKNNGSVDNLFDKKTSSKYSKKLLTWGGIVTIFLIVGAILTFSSNNLETVEDINDAFLVELATGMADKISYNVDDSSDILLAAKTAVSSHYPDTVQMATVLGEITNLDAFDDIYISIDGDTPVDSMGNRLLSNIDINLYGAQDGEVIILPPAVDESTGKEFFALATKFDIAENISASMYGVFHLDNYAKVLDLKSFGGEAFYHLCQVDGVPLILSGNSDNLFAGGDMYTFIDSFDMQNGHTSQSLRDDMENGRSAVLKYIINNEERTAVMVTVPGTDWCVVSILLDDITEQMANNIDYSTFVFMTFLIVISGCYLLLTIVINHKNQKILKKALESSYYLTNSLQSTIETDSLTKTYSRSAATEKISEAIIRCEQQENLVHTLIIADVDNFKQINDTFGHEAGDKYLMEFVSAVKSSLRTGDILGRLGGDEFVILLSDIANKENAVNVINRIISNVSAISIKDVDLGNVGISVGAVMVPEHGTDYTKLNNMADKALYSAKHAGKRTYIFYADIQSEK